MTLKVQIKLILNEAWEARLKGNYEESKQLLGKAQKLCQPEDYNLRERLFHIYMQHEYDHLNFKKALDFSNESISFYIKARNLDKIAHSIRHKADLQNELNEIDESESNYIKAINIYRSKPDTDSGDLANALRGYVLVLEKKKMIDKAVSIWEEIKDLYFNYGFFNGVVEANDKIEQLKKYKL